MGSPVDFEKKKKRPRHSSSSPPPPPAPASPPAYTCSTPSSPGTVKRASRLRVCHGRERRQPWPLQHSRFRAETSESSAARAGLLGGGVRPQSARSAPAPETKSAARGLGSQDPAAPDFYFRVRGMAVANSSPVNPVVFFDVSIGGQVRSRKPASSAPRGNGMGPGRQNSPVQG